MSDRISLFGISLISLLIMYLVSHSVGQSVGQSLRQSEESSTIVCQSIATRESSRQNVFQRFSFPVWSLPKIAAEHISDLLTQPPSP